MSSFARITGTGGYLPEKILTNQDLEKIVDTKDDWIVARTGIKQRHIVADDETTCDLAEKAAVEALASAEVKASELDLIIMATTTPDKIFPSTACLLQKRLKNHGAGVFDVQAVCSGFIYALAIADNFIRAGSATNALVVGAETLSRIVNWEDRTTCVLFGDGAGAMVLEESKEPGIMSTHLHADGAHEKLLHVPGGISRSKELETLTGSTVHMKGNEVFKMAVNTLGQIVDETLEHNNLEKSDIDWLVPHQANVRIINATARKLKMPMDNVVVTVDQHGNTSAASVPLAFNEAMRDGRIKPGQTVLMEAFGGGFTWGSALVRI